MKFGKEFVSQMVPEWHEAYMNYGHLKTLLKDIQRFKHKTSRTHSTRQAQPGQKRKLGLYRAFSGLTQRHHEVLANQTTTFDIENPVIFVDTVNRNGSERYQTKFLKTGDEGGEYELVFFRRLDDELNKVLKFYLTKVDEVIEEASGLEKQMHALIAFRIKVEKPHGWLDFSGEMSRAASDDEVSTAALSASGPSWANSNSSRRVSEDEASATALSASAPAWAKSSKRVSVEIIDEETKSQEQTSSSSDESSDDNYVANEEDTEPINKKMQEYKNYKKKKPIDYVQDKKRAQPPSPLEVLDRVKLNVTLETPLSTIKVLLNVPMQTELKFNKENLKKAEEQLKKAFVVFYHKLRILKGYSFMNILAFSKIMKKYDKIASRSASKSYMKMIDKSFLGSSNEVNKLMDRVEATFIKHFSNSNRSKGMDLLRPKARRERHRITFSFGFFAGCTVALIVALILIIRARHILDKEGGSQYMNTMFPLYSLFAFVVLHMLMYAGDVYFWRKYRVNYSFIFGFKQGTELGYRDVLYLGFSIAVLALVSVLSNLDMEMDPKTNDYKTYTELIPLMAVGFIVAILICPFNILYRSSRFFLLKSAFRCLCTPLYSVTFIDCILADQLTSQVQAFRSLEFYICYYGWGDFRHRQNTCKTTDTYNTFSFIVAAIPYTIRLLQCLRRLLEVKDTLQAYNALKYFATIVAVCTRTAYSLEKGMTWKIVAWICSGVAAITCTYWDLVIDWGLLQRHSKNRWLRDKLFIPHKSVYFVAMVLNVILRFAWLQTVLNFKITSLHTEALIAIFASLEIIRRGIWNFFRLENEHLSNVGKFRAHNSVPLPFDYDDDEEKDE